MTKRDIRFTEPLYTVAEVARLVDMPSPALASWTRGYLSDRIDQTVAIGEGVVTAFVAEGPRPSIPFIV